MDKACILSNRHEKPKILSVKRSSTSVFSLRKKYLKEHVWEFTLYLTHSRQHSLN